MNINKIGNFISLLRKEKGLTQKELGEKLYVSDKAVSKWERGISLPDITLLKKMAELLDVDVSEILEGKRGKYNNQNIEKKVAQIKLEFDQKHKKFVGKIFLFILLLIIVIFLLIIKNIYFGYDIKNVYYNHSNRNINIGVSKLSFLLVNNDRSYSYKNIRNSSVINNEIKNYLKTLKYSTCNDTIYYYNEDDDYSIINYSVKNHILFSTVSYEIVDYDYCLIKKIDEYNKKLNGLKGIHSLNGGIINKSDNVPKLLEIMFYDGSDDNSVIYDFKANLKATYYTKKNDKYEKKVLENSKGEYEIKDNKLYYYRKEIVESSNEINIPSISVFEIDNGNLILIDNYFMKYQEKIELKN